MSTDHHERRGLALHWQIIIGLAIGATAGLSANFAFTQPLGIDGSKSADATVKSVSGGMLEVQTGVIKLLVLEPRGKDQASGLEIFQPEERNEETIVRIPLDKGDVRLLDAGNQPLPAGELAPGQRVELISAAGQLVAVRSKDSPLLWFSRNIADPIGQVFLRLIFMVVIPLVFSALVVGVAGIGDVRNLGRMGLKTFAYTVVLSAGSVAIGIGLANLVRPGDLPDDVRAELKKNYTETDAAKTAVLRAKQAKPLKDMLLDIIPRNPFQEAVGALDGSSPGGGMLAFMFFALLVGVAMTLVPEKTAPILAILEGIFDVCMILIGWAMRLAPFGVAALVFRLTAELGFSILETLAWYVGTVLGGLALHLIVVYSLLVWLFARMRPVDFFRKCQDAMLTAFATSSSNATLPTALRVAEENLRVRPEVGRFVLTVGSTANQNGTALYEGITVLFLAQVFGVELTLTQQITVVLMSVLAGIGTAGVPGGSLPLVAAVLLSVGVPAEGIGIIYGVDRFLDMCRTTLNVTGDLAVAVCVDRTWQAETGPPGTSIA